MLKIYFSLHVHIYRDKTPKPTHQESTTPAPTSSPSFSTYVNEEIAHTLKMRHHSTAGNYGTALRSFLKFHDNQDIPLNNINSRIIDEYGRWLQLKGISKDTLSCYMRSLRSLYNKAVDRGLVQQSNPFKNVFTGITRTQKRSIEKTDIGKLRNLPLKSNSFKQLVRDVFLFCFYACGMPFVDVAFLKKSQLVDGFITYHRRKTDQPIQIKIEPCMEEIIQRYQSDKREYIFPFLKSTDPDEAHKEYLRKFSYYNKTLKTLGQQAEISRQLSSYVARHTWATLAFQSAVEMSIISQALGHTNTKTTQIYVKQTGNDKLNMANKKLLNEVLEGCTSVQESKLTETGIEYYNGGKDM